jgi:hypothetical protein
LPLFGFRFGPLNSSFHAAMPATAISAFDGFARQRHSGCPHRKPGALLSSVTRRFARISLIFFARCRDYSLIRWLMPPVSLLPPRAIIRQFSPVQRPFSIFSSSFDALRQLSRAFTTAFIVIP